MHNHIRRQLTLFVDQEDAIEIEAVRRKFNPIQYELINSHVTLCREDEIENMAAVLANLKKLNSAPITLRFGPPIRFEHSKGVLMPALDYNEAFLQLRVQVSEGLNSNLGRQQPHITLLHPGNSACTDEIFEAIRQYHLPVVLTFTSISLIEQVNNGQWNILQNYPLKGI